MHNNRIFSNRQNKLAVLFPVGSSIEAQGEPQTPFDKPLAKLVESLKLTKREFAENLVLSAIFDLCRIRLGFVETEKEGQR